MVGWSSMVSDRNLEQRASLQVKEDVTEWQDCSGEKCRTIRRTSQRIGRLGGEGERRCVNKTVTMAKCAPINCRFVVAGGDKECMSTNKLASVSVRMNVVALLFEFPSPPLWGQIHLDHIVLA